MSYIEVKNIHKQFKVAKRKSGVKATLKNFIKREYKVVDAIKDISFSIDKGEIVGYIGPNGAGKSTTIKILSGILVPDGGTCKIGGQVPWVSREKYVSKIGVVFGQRSQLWWDIPAEDTFDLLKDIYKLDSLEYQKTKEELVQLLAIQDIIEVPVRQLSLGQRMRCEIAASLLHKPEILFLDEPTIGLDAVSKKIVREFIKKINKEQNVTVILTTHDMSDIESLAKRIILIGKGSILYDGSLKKLKNRYDTYKYVKVYTKKSIQKLRKKGILEQEKQTDSYLFTIDTTVLDVSSFLNYISGKVDIEDIDVEHENIDNIIVKLYEEYQI
ncbi:MAG: ATP-binding cassette domain-containing protein [Bacilli bacterium]|nr:ATP-binding cassette domain-containing protein [Bacilli bacterium]